MDLINLLPHKKNTTVTVNVTTYKIDAEGICRGVADADAAKMLRNVEAWRVYTGAKSEAPRSAGAKGGIGLVSVDGTVHHKTAPAPAPAPKVESKPATPAAEVAWREPREGEDWPDPTDEMPVDYLRKMAEAYEVKHSAKTSKRDLIKKILAEMYPKKKK